MEQLIFKFIESIGIASGFLLTWYITYKTEVRKWERSNKMDQADREKDRAEHMTKWDSMMRQQREFFQSLSTSYQEQLNRLYLIYERQAEALEFQARVSTITSEKIDNHKFCPIMRERSGDERRAA